MNEPKNAESGGKRFRAARIFSVPDDVKFLDTLELTRLSEAFSAWTARAGRPDVAVSRNRVRLIYLMLRHTGARLGEVLAVNDRTDVNLESLSVMLGGGEDGPGREVQIPAELGEALAAVFDNPAYAGLRGTLFRLDQGHVRRKFYERAEECGFTKELVNPSTIRRSRAVELLRDDVPLPVVQRILGHSTADLTAAFLHLPEDQRRKVERQVLTRETRRTSARNAFFGRVARIQRGDIQSIVTVESLGGHAVNSIITNESLKNLGITEGSFVTAEIKAPWVVLEASSDMPRSTAGNRFQGEVELLRLGELTSEAIVALTDGTRLCAVVTTQSARDLELHEGQKVWALFTAFAVVLHME
ncbi:MAG: molybdenum-pterin binding domain containing protein [Solidesulfovibrio magneticus str. Maddingley MBC34]|uniref:Molybdenum-pterin binding domain containing protein n=1 Tax=Solidesulfovibrio magneticus str. Maddingley MBC34 TaxID=1206767 RepID=K6HCU6_9BACT|nr:MAG: molybdenum-pterin binding domain containing protein [Solidesulfovibrio magneticus str. Maddingley MBC34]